MITHFWYSYRAEQVSTGANDACATRARCQLSELLPPPPPPPRPHGTQPHSWPHITAPLSVSSMNSRRFARHLRTCARTQGTRLSRRVPVKARTDGDASSPFTDGRLRGSTFSSERTTARNERTATSTPPCSSIHVHKHPPCSKSGEYRAGMREKVPAQTRL